MAATASNKIKYLLATKKIDFSADVFKIILMASGYTFDKDAHETYAIILASELANGYGYTTGGYTLTGVAVVEDDTDDRAEITWNNASWTASGGAIGPSPGAIIYDDTVSSPADPVVGYIDFAGDKVQAAGGVITVASIEVRIS